jgi:anti-sigma regulatory factor (Ser/Thr protein kinase)
MNTFLRPTTNSDRKRERGNRGGLLLLMGLYSNPKWPSIVRAAVEPLSETLGFQAEHCRSVTRAADEALANIMRHSYCNRRDQPITVYFRKAQHKQEVEVQYALEIILCDRGPVADATKWHGWHSEIAGDQYVFPDGSMDTSRGIADLLSTNGALYKHSRLQVTGGACVQGRALSNAGAEFSKVVPGTLRRSSLCLQYLFLDCLRRTFWPDCRSRSGTTSRKTRLTNSGRSRSIKWPILRPQLAFGATDAAFSSTDSISTLLRGIPDKVLTSSNYCQRL